MQRWQIWTRGNFFGHYRNTLNPILREIKSAHKWLTSHNSIPDWKSYNNNLYCDYL